MVLLYAKVQFLAGTDVIQSTVAATASATGADGGNYAFETSREGTVLSILGNRHKKSTKLYSCNCK